MEHHLLNRIVALETELNSMSLKVELLYQMIFSDDLSHDLDEVERLTDNGEIID